MTKPRYPQGCPARSKARGLASSTPYANNPADYAWGVNFNNGNTNINNRDNNGFVRAVRSVAPAAPGEFQGAAQQITLRQLHSAWRRARRKKRPSANRLNFEANWMDKLLELEKALNAGTWSPAPTACFIAQRPKAREIHAPDFVDRIVHHLVVPVLERIWEPRFIFDCYSNRPGKGTHAAVNRLQGFMRQVDSGQGGGWFLQLDVKNFFNSIDRRRLWAIMKPVLEQQVQSGEHAHARPVQRTSHLGGGLLPNRRHRHDSPDPQQAPLAEFNLPSSYEPILEANAASLVCLRIVHALLRQSAAQQGVRHFATMRQRALVPPHKRLENAPPGRGLAIGNLSSQCFANIFLNELDQFVKHTLKVRRYVRYVDDLVLVHQDREQLLAWQAQIEAFLQEQLGLELKALRILKPLKSGCDFLGYVVRPSHITARPRVLHHAREALQAWEKQHVRGDICRATPKAYRRVRSIWSSYRGHLRHASAWGAQERLLRAFPWLPAATAPRRFHHRLEGRVVTVRVHSSPC